tara:strand:- start:383 stop:727 length:345 start_codon:yes stop_codon:yes gene_type:complete
MKDKLWWVMLGLAAILMLSNAKAGEWNEKPVMCEQKEIALQAVKDKGEIPLITGVQSAKVRSGTGLADRPVHIPIQIHVNFKTKTWSILEFHPTYNSVCVIGYGDDWNKVGEKL